MCSYVSIWRVQEQGTVEVEIVAGRKYSAIVIWPWCVDFNIAEMIFLRKKSVLKQS